MIIGISAKMGSGKDSMAQMIQYLCSSSQQEKVSFEQYQNHYGDNYFPRRNPWEVRKFADKLKDVVCLLLNCTREELEDREFKETPLGEEWWYFMVTPHDETTDFILKDYSTHQEFLEKEMIEDVAKYGGSIELIKTTPRLLLQLLGTDCGRKILHPNIWVNALMSEYVSVGFNTIHDATIYPNWVISDMRFPNEAQAVKDKGGVCIRINRPTHKYVGKSVHESETALDNYGDWDYVIDNDGTLDDLLFKVKMILIEMGIIEEEVNDESSIS